MNPDTSAQTGPAFTLADFTREALIVPELRAHEQAGVVQELSGLFPLSGPGWDTAGISKAALEREQLKNTATEHGVAIPHVRLNNCPRLLFALGRSATPFAWGGRGSPDVQLVFLNAIPSHEMAGYLKLISAMAKLCHAPGLLDRIKTAAGTRGILDVLREIPVRK